MNPFEALFQRRIFQRLIPQGHPKALLWLLESEGVADTSDQASTAKKALWSFGTEYFLDINDTLNSGIPDSASASVTSNPESELYVGNNAQLMQEFIDLWLEKQKFMLILEINKEKGKIVIKMPPLNRYNWL